MLQKGFSEILLLVFIFTLFIFGLTVSSSLMGVIDKTLMSKIGFIRNSQISTTPSPYHKPTNEKQKEWKLKYKVLTGEEVLTSSRVLPNAVRWGNYLFFSFNSVTPPSKKATVRQHDIKTGETRTLLSRDNDQVILQQIGEKLFIEFSGYLEKGSLFVLDLSPDNLPRLIVESRGINFYKENESYLLVTSVFGDSCRGRGDYSLFDVSTEKSTFISSLDYDCGEGNLLLGIDSKKRFLIGHKHKVDQYDEKGFFYKVEAISLNNLSKQTLVYENKMPKDVKNIHLSKDGKNLALSSDKLFIFNLNSNSLTEILSIPEKYQYGYDRGHLEWKDPKICLYDGSHKNWIGVNPDTKETTEQDPDCLVDITSTSYEQQQPERAKKLMDTLQLPTDKYSLVLE